MKTHQFAPFDPFIHQCHECGSFRKGPEGDP